MSPEEKEAARKLSAWADWYGGGHPSHLDNRALSTWEVYEHVKSLLSSQARAEAMRGVVEAAVEWNDAEVGEENVSTADNRRPAVEARQRVTRAINNLRDVTAMYRATSLDALATVPGLESK